LVHSLQQVASRFSPERRPGAGGEDGT